MTTSNQTWQSRIVHRDVLEHRLQDPRALQHQGSGLREWFKLQRGTRTRLRCTCLASGGDSAIECEKQLRMAPALARNETTRTMIMIGRGRLLKQGEPAS